MQINVCEGLMSDTAAAPASDERIKQTSALRKALIRPELGGICGTVIVFALFALFAGDSGMFSSQGVLNWSVVSAQFMIIAVGACLLMIAGEFDLSVGSMIGFAGMMIAIFSITLGWPVWQAIIVTFGLCMAIGAANGIIVVRTGLPSFIVTLAFLFILRGFTIYLPQLIERKTIIGGIDKAAEGDWLAAVFGGKILTGLFTWLGDAGIISVFERGNRAGQPVVDGIPMLIVWALLLVAFGHFVLTRTKFGNWIFASGGDAAGRALCRRAGQPRQDPDVHVHRLLRLRLRHLPGDGVRLGRRRSRTAQGVRGDHRGGDRRRVADRRLRLGHRSGPGRADLRRGPARAVLRQCRKLAVPRVSSASSCCSPWCSTPISGA
jgi:ribose/xylose/arabinose/galactoside ABC-type transport system permease subunit